MCGIENAKLHAARDDPDLILANDSRDFQGVVRNSVEGLAYTDHGRSLTLNTRDKFREWTEAWAKAFSDGRITNPEYIDAGDRSSHFRTFTGVPRIRSPVHDRGLALHLVV